MRDIDIFQTCGDADSLFNTEFSIYIYTTVLEMQSIGNILTSKEIFPVFDVEGK